MLQKQREKTEKRILGDDGEQAVVTYLVQEGYTICARNYTIRQGEIDIIAQKNEVLAFVEVKTRSTLYFPLSQVIMPAKKNKIIAAARHYIFQRKVYDTVYRFDVALLTQTALPLANASASWDITYIKDAFTGQEVFL